MLKQQQNQRRYQEAVSRFASGGEPTSTAAAAAAAGAAAPSAAPVRAPASADETNGPFSRAAIGRALDVLGRAEARGPGVVNSQGYAGQYQIGAPLAADAGVYRPAPGEISRRGEWNGQWGGTFNIPGFENVRTLRDFLENPDALTFYESPRLTLQTNVIASGQISVMYYGYAAVAPKLPGGYTANDNA